MKIAALADCHIDHGRHNGQWNNEAWADAMSKIGAGGYDACLIVGDMFERGQAAGEALNLVGESLKGLVRQGIQVVYVVGNHEWIRVPPGHRPAALTLGLIDGVHVMSEPGWVKAGELDVACLPWPLVDGEQQEESAKRLKDEASGIDGPRIAAAHAMVVGAKGLTRHGSEMDLASAGSATAGMADVDEPDVFARTLLGHVHRRQDLSPTCSYVGSIDRITFADEGQTRGYSELVWDEITSSWSEKLVTVATRDFKTIAPGADLEGIPKGTFIRMNLDEGDEGEFNWKDARRLGLKVCAPTGKQAAMDYDIVMKEAAEAMYGQTVDLMELLSTWMDSAGTPDRLKKPVFNEARERGWAA